MISDYADWPFWPETRSDEHQALWWRDCYVTAAADRQLRGVYHWFLLAGGPGSGKTTARIAHRLVPRQPQPPGSNDGHGRAGRGRAAPEPAGTDRPVR